MAQKTIVQLYDDLDGSAGEDIRPVEFSLDGANYEIDLNEANATRLREQLAEFVAAARRTGGRVKRHTAPSAKPAGDTRSKEQTKAIRDWARQNGHEISERGRIPSAVVEAFEEAHTVKAKGNGKAKKAAFSG
ncbi:histone-like nucleoid-structuring protein Lsr2 [Actinokineospora diospyrosa]|uniref:Lsr2 protein n=1 Tax=Actinokineospora diospyrosa TaxID=103728 RepID=A0ABT1I824_9PSEU|nr:Lsr2 family protein [Actinokineospora diospyrosa]MCP2268783.1 Lsr2 protein [Actinokineospora diospyrosa]